MIINTELDRCIAAELNYRTMIKKWLNYFKPTCLRLENENELISSFQDYLYNIKMYGSCHNKKICANNALVVIDKWLSSKEKLKVLNGRFDLPSQTVFNSYFEQANEMLKKQKYKDMNGDYGSTNIAIDINL